MNCFKARTQSIVGYLVIIAITRDLYSAFCVHCGAEHKPEPGKVSKTIAVFGTKYQTQKFLGSYRRSKHRCLGVKPLSGSIERNQCFFSLIN